MKSYSIDIDSTKMARKLRAIAKHSNELADELEAIDNEWQCDCGSYNYHDLHSDSRIIERICDECEEHYAMANDDDLPTRLEGSE